MRTAKAQIRLRISAVWSVPSLSANRTTRYYRMYEWRSKARMILCACAGWSEATLMFDASHIRKVSLFLSNAKEVTPCSVFGNVWFFLFILFYMWWYSLKFKLIAVVAGPQRAVGSASNCRPRDRKVEFQLDQFRGDWPLNNFYSHSPPSADPRAVASYWRKYAHLVLVSPL